mmetsp:Transcript_70194/g.121545  ORF Transcript_70194/g.121545 Transcript_70194/m.121545 type:complete len:251 (+) Transcript_70194:108-860(+)
MSENAQFKLAALTERFSGFERQMDMETKVRKDNEDVQINTIRDNIARLEKTLNSEIKRRVEANKALQGMFEAQMATVQDKLEAGLLERLDSLHVAVDSLNDRVDAVEQDFSQARERYIRDIEDKSAMVSKDVAALQTAFQNERADRRERETLIVAKLRDLEERTVERFTNDQKMLEKQHTELREELEVVLHETENGDKMFQDYILEEMAALKNGLVVESQTREHADDDIVNALNHYTTAIQDALKVVNQA